jgi:hypothetical protein
LVLVRLADPGLDNEIREDAMTAQQQTKWVWWSYSATAQPMWSWG